MRLTSYYIAHTFKNQLKKIFKSWVLIFILACMVIGGLIGFTAGMIAERMEDAQEEWVPEEEMTPEEAAAEETPAAPEAPVFPVRPRVLDGFQIFELIAGGLLLLLLVMLVMTAEKSGAKIFLPADVALLFSAPMKPQAVLLFRLTTKMGTMVLISLYMLFQLPNLILNLGLTGLDAFAVLLAWGIFLILVTLLQTFLYVLMASRDGQKSLVSTAVYVLLGVVVVGFIVYFFAHGRQLLPALDGFFNSTVSRFIPVWGWTKGLVMYTIEGNLPMAGLMLFLLIAFGAGLLYAIAHMNADFYEDAMARSEETAELVRRAREQGGLFTSVRKKERSEKISRDGLDKGFGANVIFYKTVYNRHRFAYLKYFTKTAITYTVTAVLFAVLFYFVLPELPFSPFILVSLILFVFVFYRSLGNPLDQDTRVDYFRLIPEGSFKKLMYSLLGGSYNCLLDLLPGMLIAAIILKAPFWMLPLMLLFAVTIDAYSTTVATFIDLAVPQDLGRTVKQLIQIMFIYFGLLPVAIVIGLGFVFNAIPAGLVGAGIMNVGLAALFLMFSSLILSPK